MADSRIFKRLRHEYLDVKASTPEAQHQLLDSPAIMRPKSSQLGERERYPSPKSIKVFRR